MGVTLFTGDPKFLAISASANSTLVAAVSGKRIAVLGGALSAGAAGATFKFQSDVSPATTTTAEPTTTDEPTTTEEPTTTTESPPGSTSSPEPTTGGPTTTTEAPTTTTPVPATDLTGARALAANGVANYELQGIPHFVTKAGEGLNLILSAGALAGSIVYQVID